MALRIEKSCPLPQTHSRLRQTHDLWHETQQAYPDADAFVLKLNSCIQTARSVTFVLQTEGRRRARETFDGWYEPWQNRMRADSRMRWLINARNAIEKQGDLDTHSVARVSLALTDQEQELAEVELPAAVGPQEAAAAIKLDELPERVRKQAVLVVERLWTVPELAGEELLETVAHCYGVLARVVADAHELFGVRMQTFGGETHQGRHHRAAHPTGRLPCMVASDDMRTAYWHVGADTLMEYESQLIETPGREELEEIGEEAKRRYGPGFGQHRLLPDAPMSEHARAMHEIARALLGGDGYHRGMAWLYRGGEPVEGLVFEFEDDADKVVRVRRLATLVERVGADAVVISVETWFASDVGSDDPRFNVRAAERDDRHEALLTLLLGRGGEDQQWFTFFTRDADGQVVLHDAEIQDVHDPLFDPVLQVWRRWDEAAAATES